MLFLLDVVVVYYLEPAAFSHLMSCHLVMP